MSLDPKKRTAIWDMHPSVHCSIIGTCLSNAEIRRLLIKLGAHGAESASDHDLHKQGVALAGRPQGGGKFIQKALLTGATILRSGSSPRPGMKSR
ncbi:MAG TPA: hypothetical protein VKP67_10415 [Xanthobacteraceae bacterium]|nr:hypothetical protein [Xanthobacteraceae bacterium]